ncbi:MAG: PKD domain-containing protein [Fimbriimonadales bacterium]|nr:PKD domain-containing protein [Fimbriimonadales bacterium]
MTGWQKWRLAGLVLGVAWLTGAYADVALYRGLPLEEAGVALRSWGSGTIEETTETVFVGSRSLKLTTRGYFAGGWIEFRAPGDLRADLNAPDKVMRFTLRFPGTTTVAAGGGPTGPRGGGFGESPGGARGGGYGEFGAPGAPPGGGTTTTTPPPTAQELRIVLETTDGKRTEFLLPLQGIRADESGWQSVSMPLNAIPDLKQTSGQIARLGIFSDATATFYLGEIRTLSEQTPLQGYIYVVNSYGFRFNSRSDSKVVIAANDELIFYGISESGTTPVAFRWSFGGDPNLVDAEGSAVRRRFPKKGTFTVVLTITDPYGTRKPATARIEVQVN